MNAIDRTSLAACVLGAVGALWAGGAASAHPPYRVTDLGVLLPSDDESRAFGINNLPNVPGVPAVAAVVGRSSMLGGSQAFVWLSDPLYGFSQGMKNLGPRDARDINNAGFVVGQSGVGSGQAIVWVLDAGGITTIPLGVFESCLLNPSSIAFAVNDATPPEVVGESDDDGPCPGMITSLGFRVVLDDEPNLVVLCPIDVEGNHDTGSSGKDINTAAPPLIVGLSASCLDGSCLFVRDAARWRPAVAAFTDLGVNLGAQALGTNASNQSVGWGVEPLFCGPNNFPTRALFWPMPAADPVDLGAIMPTMEQEDDESIATAINDLGDVVGLNTTLDAPLLWEPNEGTFDVTDLQAAISTCCGWNLDAAHDINDNGWIVGEGLHEITLGNFEIRAFLLVPLGLCPEDVNRDGVVDVADLIDLLMVFGLPGTEGQIYWEDVNGDCVVNVLDLIDLLLKFGTVCPGSTANPPQSLEEALEEAGLSEDDWDDFMDVMQTGTQEKKDNWHCWMTHYLSCHEGPFGTCNPPPPNCPGSDPFGGHRH